MGARRYPFPARAHESSFKFGETAGPRRLRTPNRDAFARPKEPR